MGNLIDRFVASSLALGFALSLVSGQSWAAPRIRDLGTLGGNTAFARDINEAGQIVGDSAVRSGATHAFLFTPWVGRMVDLGTLGGSTSIARAISDRGLITGSSSIAGDSGTAAFIWEMGRMRSLPSLPGEPISEGVDVNDSGVVVGQSGGVAVAWRNGTVQRLGTLGGGSSFASGINSSGVIIGNAPTPDGQFHGWVFKNGVMTDLGTFGGVSSSADGINSSGDIVGRYQPGIGQGPHAYVLRQGVFKDLGVLDSFSGANAVSNSGLIVGEGGGDSFLHAVLWDNSGRLSDLGTLPGSTFSSASSVNSGGTIVGVSLKDAGFRAVVWQ